MEIYKHRNFQQWARSEGLSEQSLKTAVHEIEQGLFDAALGSGLYKKRIAMNGRGKRGGYRVLLAFKQKQRAFFVYGFSKNERENISENEKKIYRDLAKHLLDMDKLSIEKMLKMGKLFEVT